MSILRLTKLNPDDPLPGDLFINADDIVAVLEREEKFPGHGKVKYATVYLASGHKFNVFDARRELRRDWSAATYDHVYYGPPEDDDPPSPAAAPAPSDSPRSPLRFTFPN